VTPAITRIGDRAEDGSCDLHNASRAREREKRCDRERVGEGVRVPVVHELVRTITGASRIVVPLAA
jgi:hypothetical protein